MQVQTVRCGTWLCLCALLAVAANAGWAQSAGAAYNVTINSKDMRATFPPRVRSGEKITVVVRNVNPLLYKLDVAVQEVPVTLVSVSGPNPWLPGREANTGGSWQPIRDLAAKWRTNPSARPSGAMRDAMVIADKAFRSGSATSPDASSTMQKTLDEMITAMQVKPQTKDVSEAYFAEVEKLIMDLNWEVSGADKNDRDLVVAEIRRVGKILVTLASSGYTVSTDVTMPKGADLEVTVSITARDFLPVDERQAPELSLANSGLTAHASEKVLVRLEGATRQRFSAAIIFSSVTNASYRLKDVAGDPAKGTIASGGGTDQIGFYVGTLYHFAMPAGWRSGRLSLARDWDLSMGVATNTQQLCYFVGPSLRLGDADAPGYLSIGAVGAQVRRLDGVDPGDQVVASQPIPTKSVMKVGWGVALSLRF